MLTLFFFDFERNETSARKNRSFFYKVVCLVGKLKTGKLRLWNPKEISSHITSVTQSCYRDRAHSNDAVETFIFVVERFIYTERKAKGRFDSVVENHLISASCWLYASLLPAYALHYRKVVSYL